MAVYRVDLVNGQKAIVPVSGSAAQNTIQAGSLNPVSGGAVASALSPMQTDLEMAMLPRVGGDTATTANFLASLTNSTTKKGCASFGSINLTDGPNGPIWYNYLYIPHRSGIGGDNYLYGTCLLFSMTSSDHYMWINHLIGGVWYGWLTNG